MVSNRKIISGDTAAVELTSADVLAYESGSENSMSK